MLYGQELLASLVVRGRVAVTVVTRRRLCSRCFRDALVEVGVSQSGARRLVRLYAMCRIAWPFSLRHTRIRDANFLRFLARGGRLHEDQVVDLIAKMEELFDRVCEEERLSFF